MKNILFLIDTHHKFDVSKAAIIKCLGNYDECLINNVLVVIIAEGDKENVGEGVKVLLNEWGTIIIKNKDELYKLKKIMQDNKINIFYDLSDEPVISPDLRLSMMGLAYSARVDYCCGNLFLQGKKENAKICKPVIKIIGNGKRVGKTTVSICLTNYLKEKGYKPLIVALGRGGAPEPCILDPGKINFIKYLHEGVRKKQHMASDYIEDAFFTGVPTISARRCGGGLLGEITDTNLEQCLDIAQNEKCDVIIVEGSGASIPAVDADSTLLVVGVSEHNIDILSGYCTNNWVMEADLIMVNYTKKELYEKYHNLLSSNFKKINPIAKIHPFLLRASIKNIKSQRMAIFTTKQISEIETSKETEIDYYPILENPIEIERVLREKGHYYDYVLVEFKSLGVNKVYSFFSKQKNVVTEFLKYELQFYEDNKEINEIFDGLLYEL